MDIEKTQEEVRKMRALNWFIGLSREMYLHSRATMHRRVANSELAMWSEFETRIRQVAEQAGNEYRPYDIVRVKVKTWYYSPAGFMLYVDANIDTFKRVPELKRVVSAWEVMTTSVRERRNVWDDGRLTPLAAEARMRSIMESSYEQLKLAFE